MANPIPVRQTAAQRIGPGYCCKGPLANFRFKIINYFVAQFSRQNSLSGKHVYPFYHRNKLFIRICDMANVNEIAL
jgi:hypothetical protein